MALSRADKFFYDNAGYSYPSGANANVKKQHRTRNAVKLARAEEWARENDYSFRWQEDRDATAEAEYTQWQCDIFDADGDPVTGIGGVDFGEEGEPWGDPYRRVIEAELALDVMDDPPK